MNSCRPNVFIIGAGRSGTTSLYRYLSAHPQAFASPIKETAYFCEPEALRRRNPALASKEIWKSEANYLRLFEGADDARVIFEASPQYSAWPIYEHIPERIASFNPDARFIYIMRDPVERALSNYRYGVREGLTRHSPYENIRNDPFFIAGSRYATQIKRYLAVFDAARIKTLVFEEFAQDPGGVLADLFEWLGIDPAFRPPDLGTRHNATPQRLEIVRELEWVGRLRRSAFWARSSRWAPKPVRAGARWISEHAGPRVDVSEVDTDKVADYLRPLLLEEVEELEAILGRPFPEWTTVRGDTTRLSAVI